MCPVAGLSVTRVRGTSLIRNSAPLGPYSRPMPRALWWSYGGVGAFMSEVPLHPEADLFALTRTSCAFLHNWTNLCFERVLANRGGKTGSKNVVLGRRLHLGSFLGFTFSILLSYPLKPPESESD